MGNLFRVCTLCYQPYPSGGWLEHRDQEHPEKSIKGEVLSLLDGGLSQSEVARRLGVSRQRVHLIAKGRAA